MIVTVFSHPASAIRPRAFPTHELTPSPPLLPPSRPRFYSENLIYPRIKYSQRQTTIVSTSPPLRAPPCSDVLVATPLFLSHYSATSVHLRHWQLPPLAGCEGQGRGRGEGAKRTRFACLHCVYGTPWYEFKRMGCEKKKTLTSTHFIRASTLPLRGFVLSITCDCDSASASGYLRWITSATKVRGRRKYDSSKGNNLCLLFKMLLVGGGVLKVVGRGECGM